MCKGDVVFKKNVYNKIYQENFDFSLVKSFYGRYLRGIFPFEGIYEFGVMAVFNEDLTYQNAVSYEDGVMLMVNYNYLVPSTNSGVVVYIGNKDNYGNVVIVEGDNGLDIWYGNICNVMVNIYDVISSGSYLGESCDDKIYLVYSKGNEFLNYVDYLE